MVSLDNPPAEGYGVQNRNFGDGTIMQAELVGRTAVITGGSRGIGRATAIALAQSGARVFTGDLHPRDENGERFRSLGITELTCDVRRAGDVQQLVESAVQSTGGLQIVVSNAGINMAGQVPELSVEEWDDCFDTNLRAAFLLSKFAIPYLQQAGGGSVVFLSSNAGLLPRAHDPAYSTSKAALLALARSLALCHAKDRIRVNAICPGPVSGTGLIEEAILAAADPEAATAAFIEASPLAHAFARMITPEEVAAAVVYLAGDGAAMVTGTALRIDGGKSLGVPPTGD